MEGLRRRPGLLALALAVLPALVVGLAMMVQLGAARFFDLLGRPSGPWPDVLRPLATSGALLAVFGWLVVSLPVSPLFQGRKMRQKRALVGAGCLLLSTTFWAGIVLGDVSWRAALAEAGPSLALSTPPWAYLLLVVAGAALFYGLLRPGRPGGR